MSRLLVVVVLATGTSGCSVFVAQTGTDLSQFRTQQAVHEHFGLPTESRTEQGRTEEVYITREKIALDELTTDEEKPAYFLSFGLYELYALPRELYYLGKRSTVGQELRYTYDANGRVTSLRRDQEPMRWLTFLGPEDAGR